jgi:hypothetical protein
MLQEKLKSLAELNKALEENEAWREAKFEKVKALPEYQEFEELRQERSDIAEQIDNLRNEINELTLKAYLDTGEKNPASGVGVRVYTNYVYDEDKAFGYCRSRLPAALKLDKRKFEKYVKGVQDVQPLEFVEVKEDPRPTIASDLSEYLD